jgi:hypothetical protein
MVGHQERAAKRLVLMRMEAPALMASPDCLDSAPNTCMQLHHRESVVQFINEVCEDFGLQTQTAGLAVSYFDRFLSKTKPQGLDKHRVQLLAITCTLIAAKFSEIKMPSLDDLCEVAHDKYSKAQLKEMELEALRVLQWELHAITPHAVLEQLAIVMNLTADACKAFLEHAEFFIDMSYYEYQTLSFPPLVVAASALLCAWAHLGNAKAVEFHLPQLSALCGVWEHELVRCKVILQEYFNTTFPKAVEAAEIHRSQSLAAASAAGRESPDSVMTDHAGPSSQPYDKAMADPSEAEAPEYCFSPLR